MSSSWEAPINKLGEQINELQQSLEANQQLEQEQLQQLEIARQRLKVLTQGPETTGLTELPRLLQQVMTQQTIGVIILSQDGKILLFNTVADRIFGHSLADTTSQGVQSGCEIFLEDKVTPFLGLPWDKAVKGEDVPQMQLFVKRPDLLVPEGMWISVTCTVLKGPNADVSGAVVLAIDLTEHVKISQQLGNLCKQLESQINNIETAREEIKALADKLSKKGVVEEPAAVLSPLQRPPAPSAATSAPLAPSATKMALVVDDIPVNQKLLIMHLKKMGFQVESAFNGKDAVSMVQQKDYNLIFMDCDMPVMNGYEATIAIRQDELKTGKHVPIVAMTSYDRVGDRERCLSVGMDEYLTKGVTQKQLQEVVQWCLNRGTGTQEAAESSGKKTEEADQTLDIDNLVKTFGKYELEDILKLFLMSSTTLTSCLQFAIEDQDLESVSHFAYSLKGPCASIGLTQIANISADVTKSCEEGRWVEAMTSYQRLRRLYDKVRVQIEEASKEFQWVLT